MFRRLLALLLLLALSAPALAMSGHCAAPSAMPTMHTMAHDSGHHPAPAQPERRDCIGCVLPDFGVVAAIEPQPSVALVGTARAAAALALAPGGPETPPPRT
jgi:hypothetical protein